VVGEDVFADVTAVVSWAGESFLFVVSAQEPPHISNREFIITALEKSNNTSGMRAGH